MQFSINLKNLSKLIIIIFIFTIKKNVLRNNFINSDTNYKININKYYLSDYFKSMNKYSEYFRLIDINYTFSFQFQIIKVEYYIGFYDKNNNLIFPSDLTLYSSLHLICYIEISNMNINLNTYANINNYYYKCIEYCNLKEKLKFGIKIFQTNENDENIQDYTIFFFSESIFNYYDLINKDNYIFDPIFLNENFKAMTINMINLKKNETLKLKKSYIRYPYCILKRNAILFENIWRFINIFNEYFCLCKGISCLNAKNYQMHKYLFYLNVIDNNRNIFKKTDYLFMDFIFSELSSDDAYPVFREMEKRNFSVHYLTERIDIYNEYCSNETKCLSVIRVNRVNFTINGDFLEKYLNLILKLKQVISNSGTYFNYLTNLFYNIEYIIYISITHGVCYFKYFLYNDYECYGRKKVDKILIPPIEEIISIAKKYGWEDKNIIKLNLPKWDKYKIINNKDFNSDNNINFILIMFTWRETIKNKKISPFYINNIINLVQNKALNEALKEKNIKLYFSLHHKMVEKYAYIFQKYNYIKFIEQNEISNSLKNVNLIVTDFSSIIFDIIYRKKPFIIYIPDANDTEIKGKYTKNYCELFQYIKNGTIKLNNIYFDINKTINKIFYYINNNYKLDPYLIKLYDKIGLKDDNNIEKFIQYLIK